MGIVESRNCRCNFDSKEQLRIPVAPLDARGFCTYAYIQKNQSEATGTRKRQATKEFAGLMDFS